MDALYSHIEETGKMEVFVSGNHGSLAVRESGEIEQAAQSIELENKEVKSEEPNQEQCAALVRSSAEFAAGMEIAKYTIANQFLKQYNLAYMKSA